VILHPSLAEARALASQGNLCPLYCEVPADLETPVSAFLKVARGRYSFLLESVEGGERLARYSFIGTEPYRTLRSGPGLSGGGIGDPLRAVEAELGRFTAVPVPGLPRFTGGAVGYLTWDAARLFERLPDHHGAAKGTVAAFSFYRSLVAFDHVRQRLVLMALAGPGSRVEYERALSVLDGFEQDLGWERRPSGRQVELFIAPLVRPGQTYHCQPPANPGTL